MPARNRRHGHPRASVRRLKRSANVAESLETRWLLSDYVVNTTADETITNSTTSLREAVILAEATAGDDRIFFDEIVFPHSTQVPLTTTIVLTQGPIAFLAPTVGKTTIDGTFNSRVTLSGGDANRIFSLDTSADVALAHLVLREGFSNSSGGAIGNAGHLVLDNLQLRDNHVVGGNGSDGVGGDNAFGGAITNTASGTIDIIDSIIDGNSATGGIGGPGDAGAAGSGGNATGGAIYNLGDITMSGSFVTNNKATGGPGGPGAVGVGGDGGDALGGGIFVSSDATLDITDSSLNGNSLFGGAGGPTGPGQFGGRGGDVLGGALASNGDVNMVEANFSSNSATAGDGGGLSSGGQPGPGGDANGGAIFNASIMVISLGQIGTHAASGGDSAGSGGTARGGAISNDGTLSIFSVNLVGGVAAGGDGGSFGGEGQGGGIFHAGPDALLEIIGGAVRSNAARGGAGATQGPGRAMGGGIHALATFSITAVTILDNIATGANGSADSGSFGGGGLGGGLFMLGGFTGTIARSTLSGNVAQGGNGASSTAGGGATGGQGSGGAIYLGSHLEMDNSTVYDNSARGGVGGTGTTTGGAGGNASGGAFAMDNTTFDAINVTIASNAATAGAGGTGGTSNGAIGASSAGAFSISDIVTLTNTIVADNTAQVGPNIIGSLTLINSLISTPPGDYTPAPGSANNLLNTPANLGPLQDNGGPTKTALPNPNSAAINAGNDLAAGVFGVDQRGAGFPRFAGLHVDIGAVEIPAPLINVRGNGASIADGDTTPSTADHTDFGSVAQGAAPLQRTFTVRNTGTAPLQISNVAVPTGFEIVEPLDPSIVPGDTDTFTVALRTTTAGTFSGNVVIASNVAGPLGSYSFAIKGVVTPPTSSGTIRINFQPAGRPIPATYLADTGAVFGNRGNGQTYGWNLSASSFTRDRGIDADQRKDTLVHTQLFGPRVWEIQVPNGTYRVHLVAGDPQYFDSVYKINLEGVLTINGTPSSGTRFFEATRNIVVTDGRLTIANASGAVNNKLSYVDITRVVAINFQPSGRPVPAGYLADIGSTFGSRGNGFSYGWNSSASSFMRDRGLLSDQRLDTLVHTQLYGVRTWDLAVPNGTYSVFITAGDPRYFDSVYRFNVEGQLTVNGTPTSGNRFISGTKTVTVTDGKLMISNASGSVNNKLAFVEVTPV